MILLNWFFALLFLSISSIFSEQSQTCVNNEPKTHQVLETQPKMRFWNQWWCRRNFQLRTDVDVQVNLLRECEQKTAELPEHQKLTKLCSDPDFLKNSGKGQFFITFEEEGPGDMQTLCREYTLPRKQRTSRARGWIRGNTKIGPVLDVKVTFSSRTFLCWYYDRILISRPNSFLGSHREWNQQIRNWNVRRNFYWMRRLNMDARIRLKPMRENPPTIKTNKACTGKPVAHFSRTHVAKVSDGGTGNLSR